MLLTLTDFSVLTTLNVLDGFCVKVVIVLLISTVPLLSDHVMLGLGYHLLATAFRIRLEKVNVVPEKAEHVKMMRTHHDLI